MGGLTSPVSETHTGALQGRAALDDLLGRLAEARADDPTPVFLKVAPDLTADELALIVEAAIDHWIDALIVSNTTLDRPDSLRSAHKGEAGGLSGAPLGPLALERLRDFRTATGAKLPLVSAGGIASGADAYARIRAGASLVQLYTAMIYEGPSLPRRIVRELDALLARDGFARLGDALGVGA